MTSSIPALRTGPEIGLSGATFLEMGLEALRDGDHARAFGALASIDNTAWSAILDRFPHLVDVVRTWGAER